MLPARLMLLLLALLPVCVAQAEVHPARTESVSAAVQSTPPSIPYRQTGEVLTGGLLWRMLIAVVAGIGIAVAVLVWLRKYVFKLQVKGKAERHLRVIEAVRLSSKATVFLLRANGRDLVVGQIGDSLVRLDKNVAPVDETAGNESPGDGSERR